MNIAKARHWLRRTLQQYDIDNSIRESILILEIVTGRNEAYLRAHENERLSPEQQGRLLEILDRRCRHEPLAYIEGEQAFFGRTFRVGPGCLVPRPETELLVEHLCSLISPEGMVIDWGTGSGCIAISILGAIPEAQAVAVDCSPLALGYAWENARRQKVERRLLLWHSARVGDMPPSASKPSLLVSNPPYIPTSETARLMPEVARYEPLRALDGGEDGLWFAKQLLQWAGANLAHGGLAALEIGGQSQLTELRRYAPTALVLAEAINDYNGIERIAIWKHI
ncbi:MAG: peptide chain release factor N(5)-glutamine methyltransferase [Synergistales bacterium]|nr:peptide chain release factor N(5)-glutamine methyltransferase [Synergistales bacterium]